MPIHPSSPMTFRLQRNVAIISITGVKFDLYDMKQWSRGKELKAGPKTSPVAFILISAEYKA